MSDNNINVIFRKMPNTHSITLGLYIKAGQAYGDESCVGITHFLEHLHFRKSGEWNQDELYYEMESMGSTLRATTYRDFLKFSMKITPDKLDKCISLFQNLLNTKGWTDEEFQREKQVVLNQIIEQGTYVSLDEEARKLIFREHPLSHAIMGNMESIERIGKKEIQEYKDKIFHAGNMLLCVTGNISDSDCWSITRAFNLNMDHNSLINKKPDYPKCFHHRKPDIKLVYVQDENPLEINMAFDIKYNRDTTDLLSILNCILGEGVGSRIQRKVREDKCYTSDIFSYIEWYQEFAVLHIRFSVEKKNLLPCFEEILNIIKELKENISQKDLDVSLPFYTTNLIFNEDDTEEMNFQLAYNKLVLNMDYHVPAIDNDSHTIVKLQDLAREIFVKKNITIVVLGNTRQVTQKAIVQLLEERL